MEDRAVLPALLSRIAVLSVSKQRMLLDALTVIEAAPDQPLPVTACGTASAEGAGPAGLPAVPATAAVSVAPAAAAVAPPTVVPFESGSAASPAPPASNVVTIKVFSTYGNGTTVGLTEVGFLWQSLVCTGAAACVIPSPCNVRHVISV